jgi:hypothetical protein
MSLMCATINKCPLAVVNPTADHFSPPVCIRRNVCIAQWDLYLRDPQRHGAFTQETSPGSLIDVKVMSLRTGLFKRPLNSETVWTPRTPQKKIFLSGAKMCDHVARLQPSKPIYVAEIGPANVTTGKKTQARTQLFRSLSRTLPSVRYVPIPMPRTL